MSRLLTIAIGVLAAAWVAAVTMWTLEGWPRLPLDVPARDAAIQALHQKAVTAHVVRGVALGAIPIVVLGVALLVVRRRGRRR